MFLNPTELIAINFILSKLKKEYKDKAKKLINEVLKLNKQKKLDINYLQKSKEIILSYAVESEKDNLRKVFDEYIKKMDFNNEK